MFEPCTPGSRKFNSILRGGGDDQIAIMLRELLVSNIYMNMIYDSPQIDMRYLFRAY